MINNDKLKIFPDQNLEGRYTECVGETVADMVGNLVGVPMDAGFAYAAALRIAGGDPTTEGADPKCGMLGAVGYGCLPVASETFSAKTMGELYEANLDNYSAQQKTEALKYAQNGIQSLTVNFDTIVAEATAGNLIQLDMKWYPTFAWTASDGIIPVPNTGNVCTLHATEVVGVDDAGNLLIKPWLGQEWGDKGLGHMSRSVFELCALQAFTFDANASRFWSLIGIAITRFPFMADYVSKIKPGATVRVLSPQDTLYDAAVKCLGTRQTLDQSVPAELSCAEAVCAILRSVGYSSIPDKGFASTRDLDSWLATNIHFKQVSAPQYGGVIVSPTKGGMTGHAGIMLKRGIASNNSFDNMHGAYGTFTENYSYDGWITYFQTVRKLDVHYYIPV